MVLPHSIPVPQPVKVQATTFLLSPVTTTHHTRSHGDNTSSDGVLHQKPLLCLETQVYATQHIQLPDVCPCSLHPLPHSVQIPASNSGVRRPRSGPPGWVGWTQLSRWCASCLPPTCSLTARSALLASTGKLSDLCLHVSSAHPL